MSSETKISQFYYKNNRLQQIRGFCNTVAFGSPTKAAKIMNLSQSAVSLQIKTLERDLKTSLLKRSKKNGKKFELTEEGKIFYEMAWPTLDATDGLYERFFLKTTNHRNSLLRIGSHHSAFSILLPKTLKKLKDSNPELKLELSYLTKQEAFESLMKDEIDAAFYPIENIGLIPRGLEFQEIAEYKPALITPIGHPLNSIPDEQITFEEIGKYNFLHTGSYAISDVMQNNIASKVLTSDIELNHGSWDILKSLVAAGLGVTIFHEDYCQNSTDITIKKVGHLSPKIAYYAIFQKGGRPKKLVSDLVDLVLGQVGSALGK